MILGRSKKASKQKTDSSADRNSNSTSSSSKKEDDVTLSFKGAGSSGADKDDDRGGARSFRPHLKKPVFEVPSPGNSNMSQQNNNTALDGQKLLVGAQINMSGEIKDCDTLIVEGSVDATTVESRVVDVAQGGRLKGDVKVDEAYINGSFKGTMKAANKLYISASGRVSGKIRYGLLEIETGGVIAGDVGALGEKAGDDAEDTARDIATSSGSGKKQKKSA